MVGYDEQRRMSDVGEDWTEEELDESLFKEYRIEKYIINSLKEIRDMIKKNKYGHKQQVESHQEFLENVLNKLIDIKTLEKSEGEINFRLDNCIDNVRKLYKRLDKIKMNLEDSDNKWDTDTDMLTYKAQDYDPSDDY